MSNYTRQKFLGGSVVRSKLSLPLHNSFTVYLFTILLVVLPSLSRCHVGSLPLGKERNQEIRDIIYCNFVKLGDGKPPLLNHVRVSRGPSDEYNTGLGAMKSPEEIGTTGRLSNFIKSPSYQHKMLHHASQFHGNPSSFSSPRIHSGTGGDFGLGSNPIYPVASVYMKGSLNRKPGVGIHSNNVEVGEEELTGDSEYNRGTNSNPFNGEGGDYSHQQQQEDPTFTPFIGARALSNIPKFFKHLRENLEALQHYERLEGLPSWEESEESETIPPAEHEHKDLPSRRGDYFQSDGRLSINPDEYGYSYDGKPVAGSGTQSNTEVHKSNQDYNGHEASKDLLNYMGRDPKYKKANNYNPSWLFTNLGLGKRSN